MCPSALTYATCSYAAISFSKWPVLLHIYMCDDGDKTKVAKIKIDQSHGKLKSLKHTILDFSVYGCANTHTHIYYYVYICI